MHDPAPSLEAAVAHLRSYGDRYSVKSLVEQLRQLGASQEVLDEAVRIYQDSLQGTPKTGQSGCFWAALVFVVLLAFGFIALIGFCRGLHY